MNKYIDTHCHIIPGVDDGAKNIKETREMLRMAYDEGIRCIVATPHHHPIRGMADVYQLRRNINKVRKEATRIDKRFKVYLGMEVFFTHEVPAKILAGEVKGINNKKLILLEFSPKDEFSYINQAVKLVQSTGVDIIMAHCERYLSLYKDMDRIRYLDRLGIKFQVNASSIIGDSGRRAQRFIRRLMDEDYVFCVGTDAHNTTDRVPMMDDAAKYVEKYYGKDYMKKIFFTNPASILTSK